MSKSRPLKNLEDYQRDALLAKPGTPEALLAQRRLRAYKAYRRSPQKALKQRDNNLRNLYGIDLEDYEQMLKAQDGRCGICRRLGSEIVRKVGSRRTEVRGLDVDHCHATGKIRGLLCHRCNRGLGSLGDTVESLERVIAYLKATS